VNLNQNFIISRLRLFDLADVQIIWARERVAEHCSHRGTPKSHGRGSISIEWKAEP